jgi:hypothetical protein
MKHMKSYMILLLAAFMFACTSEVDPDLVDEGNNGQNESLAYQSYTSETYYGEIGKRKHDGQNNYFRVISAKVEGKEFVMQVSYSQSCTRAEMEVVLADATILIYPPQIGAYLNLKGNNCLSNGTMITKTVKINLEKAFTNAALIEGAKITLENASIDQRIESINGVVKIEG